MHSNAAKYESTSASLKAGTRLLTSNAVADMGVEPTESAEAGTPSQACAALLLCLPLSPAT